MDAFTYITVLLSIVLGLAITQVFHDSLLMCGLTSLSIARSAPGASPLARMFLSPCVDCGEIVVSRVGRSAMPEIDNELREFARGTPRLSRGALLPLPADVTEHI